MLNYKMNNVVYHEVTPSNDKGSFKEFESIDFEIQAEGRKLLKNSIVFEADIEVRSSGNALLVDTDIVKLEHKIGFHGVCESWNVSNQVGSLENIQDYGRYVNMLSCATLDKMDYCNIRYQVEGRQVTEDAGRAVIQPQRQAVKESTSGNVNRSAHFCLSPKICLNSMVGDNYSFAKNGSIRVSTNLARNNAFLFGGGFSGHTYTLSNVRIKFSSVPDDGAQKLMMMNSVVSVKQALNSNAGNISARVPAKACSGVMISFIEQDHENKDKENSYALERLPNIDEVQYLFNNSTSQGVSYVIDDAGELISRGLDALSEAGHQQANPNLLAANGGYLIGLDFKDTIDLSAQKFNVQIRNQTPAITSNARLVFLYFLNRISL